VSPGEQVVLFQVGARLFAARAAGVERIGPADSGAPGWTEQTALGSPLAPARGLFCAGEAGALGVDRVLGLRAVPEADLRPLPPPSGDWLGTRAVTGLVLLDGALTPLVDLPTLLREQRPPAAAGPR
jgi:chemotaxis signal transduction protein